MSFDDILEPKRRSTDDSVDKIKQTIKPKTSQSGGASGLNSLLGGLDAGDISKRLGLNEELTQQVVVPLLAILDKHGGSIMEPDGATANTIGTVSNLFTEFAPLIQGAYKYFSGVKSQLDEADAALLQANAAALSASDLNSLFGQSNEISQEEVTAPQEIITTQPNVNPIPFAMKQVESAPPSILESGKIDYYELLGAKPKSDSKSSGFYTSQQQKLEAQQQAESNWKVLPSKSMTLIEDAALAVENGLTAEQVRNSDNTYRMNGGDVTDYSIDLTEATPTQLEEGVSDIMAAMKLEKQKLSSESKNPEDAYPTMTAEELVGHIKQQARPTQGGQGTSDSDYFRKQKVANYGDWKPPTDAMSIRGGEELVKNAFNIGGLAEAMAQERDTRERDSKGEFNDGRTPDTLFIEGLDSATQQEQANLQQDSEISFNEGRTQDWSAGSLNDLSPEELGLDDFELNEGISDKEQESREPKRNQIR